MCQLHQSLAPKFELVYQRLKMVLYSTKKNIGNPDFRTTLIIQLGNHYLNKEKCAAFEGRLRFLSENTMDDLV